MLLILTSLAIDAFLALSLLSLAIHVMSTIVAMSVLMAISEMIVEDLALSAIV